MLVRQHDLLCLGPDRGSVHQQVGGLGTRCRQAAHVRGYGSFERAVDTLEAAVTGKQFISGDKFSAADVVIGSQIGFMTMFKLLERRPAITNYIASVTDRHAYRRGKQLDQGAAETMSQQAS